MFRNKNKNDIRYYKLDINELEIKKAKRWNWIYFSGMFLLWILAGLVNQDSSRIFYVLFPYYFIFLPIIYFGYGAFNFSDISQNMDGVTYDGSIRRMHRSGLGIIILTGINILLDAIYIVVNFQTADIGKEILYILCLLGVVIVGVLYGKDIKEGCKIRRQLPGGCGPVQKS